MIRFLNNILLFQESSSKVWNRRDNSNIIDERAITVAYGLTDPSYRKASLLKALLDKKLLAKPRNFE